MGGYVIFDNDRGFYCYVKHKVEVLLYLAEHKRDKNSDVVIYEVNREVPFKLTTSYTLGE